MKILIVGSGGRLGAALMREYQDKFNVTGLSHAQIDLADFDEVEQMLSQMNFDLLINCAALTNVDLCEEQPDQAFQVNAGAPDVMAEICAGKNARLIHFSTDYVFNGKKREPYVEEDEAVPISVYGQSKREGEENVLAAGDGNLVVRVSWVFGPERPSFIDNIIERARGNESIDAIADKVSTPTYTRDIARMLPEFFDVGASRTGSSEADGILHFASAGECSWQEYAQHTLDCCHHAGVPLKAKTVGAIKLSDMKNWVARRPAYSVLSTAKYAQLTGESPRSWRDAVADYVRDYIRI
ncbi:MAG TPA: dTDP-4-dehydrorhamnose reductase [Chthoniobacterales bacterium]|nr:dTDP-4-dehydrorhamnose reductase [Chthoniobacterales bacterium]